MKLSIIALALLLGWLQYKFWWDSGGIRQYHRLKAVVAAQLEQNARLKQRNQVLIADIKDLKYGAAAIEERARQDLGMVKPGESYYQIVE